MSASEPARELLTLGMEGEVFAIDAHCVREILDMVPVTAVPGSQPFVNGLVNVRGKVVPLADLRLKFGMRPRPPTIDTRIVVIDAEVQGEITAVGLLADRVYEVTELASAAIEETPRIGLRWRQEYILGIGKRGTDFIIILDIGQILAGNADATLRPVNEPLQK
jgi:Chemotaxis signal transduction protein